jgi:hypothetical protein
MEQVLDVYTRPADSAYPVICMDELPIQLLGDAQAPLPVTPKHPVRVDYEYVRHGVRNLFLAFDPIAGQRHVSVTTQRTRQEWVAFMRNLADVYYPDAERITVVLDNLNTHTPASFYQVLPPAEAHRLMQRFEFVYTPKHGSWLNMAEIELSVLSRQCLSQRIPDDVTLVQRLTPWTERRNMAHTSVNWRFTTADARITLKKLYPSLES